MATTADGTPYVTSSDSIVTYPSTSLDLANRVDSVSASPTLALGSASAPSLRFKGNVHTGLWGPSASTVAVSTGGTERMRIDSSGNVGIGTSSPAASLHVVGNVGITGGLVNPARNDQTYCKISINDVNTANDTNGDLIVSAYYPIIFKTDLGYERMRIARDGLITGTGPSLGAWTAYTPTWGGNTTNPVIGNGTIAGAYCQIGKMVFVRVLIVAGSTTTFGSGSYYISMPVTAKSTYQPMAHGFLEDISAGTRYLAILTPASTTNLWLRYSAQPVDTNATTPMTWAQNDTINVSFMYEAA